MFWHKFLLQLHNVTVSWLMSCCIHTYRYRGCIKNYHDIMGYHYYEDHKEMKGVDKVVTPCCLVSSIITKLYRRTDRFNVPSPFLSLWHSFNTCKWSIVLVESTKKSWVIRESTVLEGILKCSIISELGYLTKRCWKGFWNGV